MIKNLEETFLGVSQSSPYSAEKLELAEIWLTVFQLQTAVKERFIGKRFTVEKTEDSKKKAFLGNEYIVKDIIVDIKGVEIVPYDCEVSFQLPEIEFK